MIQVYKITVDTAIKAIFDKFTVPLFISVNINVKFKNGTIENIGIVVIPVINAIMLSIITSAAIIFVDEEYITSISS